MTKQLTRFEALKAVVETAGTQQKFAKALGVTQPSVSLWLNQSKQLPAEYVLTAEHLYGVSRHDLRPDIYPRPKMRDGGMPDRFHGVHQGGLHKSEGRAA
jgi:DNA-binding transcriptional regulator YdaS (Cro superfamily)